MIQSIGQRHTLSWIFLQKALNKILRCGSVRIVVGDSTSKLHTFCADVSVREAIPIDGTLGDARADVSLSIILNEWARVG